MRKQEIEHILEEEMTTKHNDCWTAEQLELEARERASDMDILARIGSRSVPSSWNNFSNAATKSVAITSDQVVNDMLHQLRVQMEPPFVQRFIASLTPASRDWIKANEDQAQTNVAEALKASGMSLDQLKSLLDSNAEK